MKHINVAIERSVFQWLQMYDTVLFCEGKRT